MKKQTIKNSTEAVLQDKLQDAESLSFVAECSPEEAHLAGAFKEDALNEQDALESQIDLAKSSEED